MSYRLRRPAPRPPVWRLSSPSTPRNPHGLLTVAAIPTSITTGRKALLRTVSNVSPTVTPPLPGWGGDHHLTGQGIALSRESPCLRDRKNCTELHTENYTILGRGFHLLGLTLPDNLGLRE